MWKSIINDAFKMIVKVSIFKWIINSFYEYRIYILLALFILALIGLIIEIRERRKKKNLEEEIKEK